MSCLRRLLPHLCAIFGLFSGSLIVTTLPASAGEVDRVAAVVNDEVITLSEIYELGGDYIAQAAAAGSGSELREKEIEVLDSLIMRKLIVQELARLGMDVTEPEVDRTLEDIAARNNMDRARLRREVEASGLPWEDYLAELKENVRQMKFSQAVIQPRITVDEDALLDLWRRRFANQGGAKLWDLGVFVMSAADPSEAAFAAAKDRAEAARQRVLAGENFDVVATAVNESKVIAGGKLGVMEQGTMLPAAEAALVGLNPGGLSEPVLLPQVGYLVYYVYDIKGKEPPPFESVREELMQELYSSRIEDETDQWYRQTRRRSAVEVKLEIPGGG